MFLFTLLQNDSVSRACQVPQTVRWRFGTFYRGITKPFFLPDGRALLKLKAEQLKIVNKKKKKKSRKVYYLTELTVYYSSKN